MKYLTVREITILSACIAILFVQEQILSFLPGIQFTVLLMVVYSNVFRFQKSLLIVLVHILIDNMFMGTLGQFNIVIPMLITYPLIPIFVGFVFPKEIKPIYLAVFSVLFGAIYSLTFIPFQVIILDVDPLVYFMAGIPIDIITLTINFVTVYWLYQPLQQVIDNEVLKREVILKKRLDS